MSQIYFLISLFFFSIDSYAVTHLDIPCLGEKVSIGDYSQVEAIEKHLEWHGADNNQVPKAPCKTLNPPSHEEMSDFIKMKSESKSKINSTINGVSFSNESPALINAFRDLTTAMDSFGIGKITKNQKNFQKEYGINPECKKVICAVEKIWGEDLGLKVLYMYQKHNFNTSEYAFNDSDRLSPEEMDDVVMGAEDLPKTLIPLGRPNQRLTHFSRGYRLKQDSENVAANSVIMLFDTWSREPRFERQYSVFHELAHNVSTKLKDMDESPSWLKLSDWIKKGDDWSSSKSACFTTKYGLTNPYEDYAEALSTYRYNPKEFKNSCPKKYEYLKEKVFKGKEYLDVAGCTEFTKGQVESVANLVSNDLKEYLESSEFENQKTAEKCSKSLTSYPTSDADVEACLNNSIVGFLDANRIKLQSANSPKVESTRMAEFQSLVADTMMKNGSLSEVTSKKNDGLKKEFNKYFDELIQSNLPKKISGKFVNFKPGNAYNFGARRSCTETAWKTIKERRECVANAILEEDQRWLTFSDSYAFNKLKIPESLDRESTSRLLEAYRSEIKKIFLETDFLDEVTSKITLDIEDGVKRKLNRAHLELYYDKSDWKKMDALEFCEKYYGSTDEYDQKYILPASTKSYPKMVEWCVKKQSEKSKRFIINENDFKEYSKAAFN
jgi:hypothetical protein